MSRKEDFSYEEAESFTVFIGNLPRDSIQGDVEHIFDKCRIKSIRMVRDRETDTFRGHAFVDFEDEQSLETALKLDKALYGNRELKIDRAQNNRNRNQGFRGGGRGGGGGGGVSRGGFGGDGADRPRGRGGYGGRGGGGGGGGNYHRDYQQSQTGGGGYRGRGGGGSGSDGGSGGGDYQRRQRQSSSDELPSDNPPPGRPKLNLLPRTVGAPVNSAAPTKTASSIFGSGRPRPPTPPNEQGGTSASASADQTN